MPLPDGSRPLRPSSGTIGNFAAFIAAFVVLSAVIRIAAPPNPDFAWHPTYTAKIEHIRTTSEHYEVVFVGDSRAYRGIDLGVLDAELERLECPASTYNMGTLGMSKFEYDRIMDAMADAPGGTPEIVVNVEVTGLLAGLLKDFSVRQRGHMNLADAKEYLAYKANLPADDFGTDNLELIDTAAGFGMNQLPIGAIHQQLFSQPATQDEDRLVGEQRGFEPWPEFEAEAGPEGMANLRATITAELDNGGWEQRWAVEAPGRQRLDQWLITVASHLDAVPEGATALQLFIPSFYDEGTISSVVDGWEESGRPEPIINLVDTELIGDFTDPSYFLDYWHLSAGGSEAVSKALAQQLCPVIQDELGR